MPITDVNPFVYSHPLAPDDIIDRDEETEVARNVVGGHYVRLYAPRKYGKTSLLKRALRDGEVTEGLIPVTSISTGSRPSPTSPFASKGPTRTI